MNAKSSPSHPAPDELSPKRSSHLRLLFIIIASIFFAEVVAMAVIYDLPILDFRIVTLIDAGVMTILIFPVLYFLSFRPLLLHINKRYQAEKAIKAERQRFNDILETLPGYLVLLTADYHVSFANRFFRERFGESQGQRCYEYLFGRSQPCEICETYKVLNTMKPGRWEWTGPDGRNYDVYDYPFTDTDGSAAILEMGIDITEQKQAEGTVRHLSRIVEQTEDTVVVTNCDGVIEYVNPAFERLTGYTKEEALGKTPRVIKSDIHDVEFYRDMWNTILTGEVFQSEIANRKKNGEVYYEVKTIAPLRDAQGKITHFVATGKDITEHRLDEEKLRKAYDQLELRVQERTEELRIANSELEEEIIEHRWAEAALRESEEKYRKLVQYAPAAIYEMDLQGTKFLSVNDVMCNILRYSREELLATKPADLLDEESKLLFKERIRKKLAGEKIDESVGYRIRRKDGVWIYTDINVGAITFVHEEPSRVVVIGHDITERKLAEDELRRMNEELARFNRNMVGRELRMIELKKEVNELRERVSQPPRYALDFEKDEDHSVM